MRRLVLVLFAFALVCQGALASLSPGCRATPCCAELAMAQADGLPQAVADDSAASAPTHAPCDADAEPCDQDGCQCHAPALAALLVTVPGLPSAAKSPRVSGRYLQPAPQQVPDGPQRPPRASAR